MTFHNSIRTLGAAFFLILVVTQLLAQNWQPNKHFKCHGCDDFKYKYNDCDILFCNCYNVRANMSATQCEGELWKPFLPVNIGLLEFAYSRCCMVPPFSEAMGA